TDLADRPVFLEVQVSDILLLDHPEHPFWLPPSPRTSGAWVDRGGPLFLHHRPSDWDTFRVAFTPRAWGRRPLGHDAEECVRFTPTRVGTTDRSGLPRCARPVHPHARGDDSKRTQRKQNVNGSPPRAWGRQE